jgi:hypothetical protein
MQIRFRPAITALPAFAGGALAVTAGSDLRTLHAFYHRSQPAQHLGAHLTIFLPESRNIFYLSPTVQSSERPVTALMRMIATL